MSEPTNKFDGEAYRETTQARLAQLAAENQKLRAALYQIEFPLCLVCFRRYPVGHASDCVIGQVLATTSAPAVVPREDAEALAEVLDSLCTPKPGQLVDWIIARDLLAAYRAKHPKP